MKNKIGYSIRLPSLIAVASMLMVGVMSGCQAKPPKAQEQNAIQAAPSTSPSYDAQKTPAVPDTAKSEASAPAKLIVYYFHGNARCPTCFKLENYAKSEVENDFADAIKKGTLEWKTINIDDQGNEHYAQDYKLYTKSVIVSIRQNGKESSWKNLDQIWQLVHEEPKYREYIKKEVAACLEGKCL